MPGEDAFVIHTHSPLRRALKANWIHPYHLVARFQPDPCRNRNGSKSVLQSIEIFRIQNQVRHPLASANFLKAFQCDR
jgi:hypothetical protein